MSVYAMFKLPRSGEYTKVLCHSEPEELSSLKELNGREGFVIAPFQHTSETPILLLHPEEIITAPLASGTDNFVTNECLANDTEERAQYGSVFSVFHSAVVGKRYAKLVLARQTIVQRTDIRSLDEYFFSACVRYPHQFVALFSTPKSGTWLMATPEILLTGNGTEWQTMALAGTMQHNGRTTEWSEKDREEQRYVADYIRTTLSNYAEDVEEAGVYDRYSAHLVHLCSDFRFFLKDKHAVGDLLDALHPTPAVCGIPKEAAKAFILENEQSLRKYYSGFVGMLSPNGVTHLYVSLRCMQIDTDVCRLYAGSGILSESHEEAEWQETESKLSAMRNLLIFKNK